ncbi:SpoIID/LytB domain-containing protein [Patescibacteria group bacterium]|nr:SpoIID/LytB domain-containing protein [Patescibacteria group bacterium]
MKRPIFKRLFVITIALVMGMTFCVPLAAAQDASIEQQLAQAKAQKEFFQAQQDKLEDSTKTSNDALKKLNESLEKQQKVVQDATKKIEAINRKLTKLKRQRAVAMRQSYISGINVSYIYALLDSGSLSEFLSKGEYANLLARKQASMAETVDQQIDTLEKGWRDLIKQQNSAEAEIAALQKKIAEIKQALADNNGKLASASALEAYLLSLTGNATATGCRKIGSDEASDSFTLAGSGTDHGLGMSQYGAKGAADHGRDYRQILSHYYTGTSIGDIGSFQTNKGESEAYLVGVVDAEVNTNWSMEALKAQAVAARSYAYINSNRLDNSQNTQAWEPSSNPRAQQAVRETRGQVLKYGGDVIPGYYHSTSGGCTENSENVGWSYEPYLRGVSSPWEEDSPSWNWNTRTFSKAEMQSKLGGLVNGSLQSVRINSRGVSGRVINLDVVGSGGTTRITVDQFRDRLSGSGIRSSLFGF